MGSIFTEENIRKLFGNEAAENEPIERLKEYYFKSSVYDKVVSDLPLKILVGHKGIGKSALFKIAMSEDIDKGIIPLLIKPDDILELASENKSLIELIRDWKNGLTSIVAKKILESFGLEQDGVLSTVTKYTGKIVGFLSDTVTKFKDDVDLKPGQKLLVETFIKKRNITIYLDDLDRGWEGRPFDIKRISALLNAARDLSSDNEGIKFRIALRSDVYFLVRTSDESTDKIEGSVTWHSWTNHQILVLLIKRIETFFGRDVDEKELLKQQQSQIAHYLTTIFRPRFTGRGKWENAPMRKILMSLIRKRPRDLVKLCTAAAKQAFDDGENLIHTIHLEPIFEDYSQGRIQDTINEYKTELPEIERLIFGMKPSRRSKIARESFAFSTADLLSKIDNVIQSGVFKFSNGKVADKKELAQFLYKINFLTAWKKDAAGKIQRKDFEENRYLSNRFADFGFSWEIHPAYRWALQPDKLEDLFNEIENGDETE